MRMQGAYALEEMTLLDELTHVEDLRAGRLEPESLARPSAARVLLLEDDPAMRDLLATVLADEGYEVVEGDSTSTLCARMAAGEVTAEDPVFDLVVSDVRMPGRTGLEIVEGLRKYDFLQPVILVTAFGGREVHAEAERLGASLLDKPFEMADLVRLARELCPPGPDPYTEKGGIE